MTNNPEIFYFFDEKRRIVYHSNTLIDDRPDLIFLGSSINPNKQMAVATFVKGSDQEHGYTIKQLP